MNIREKVNEIIPENDREHREGFDNRNLIDDLDKKKKANGNSAN